VYWAENREVRVTVKAAGASETRNIQKRGKIMITRMKASRRYLAKFTTCPAV